MIIQSAALRHTSFYQSKDPQDFPKNAYILFSSGEPIKKFIHSTSPEAQPGDASALAPAICVADGHYQGYLEYPGSEYSSLSQDLLTELHPSTSAFPVFALRMLCKRYWGTPTLARARGLLSSSRLPWLQPPFLYESRSAQQQHVREKARIMFPNVITKYQPHWLNTGYPKHIHFSLINNLKCQCPGLSDGMRSSWA